MRLLRLLLALVGLVLGAATALVMLYILPLRTYRRTFGFDAEARKRVLG